MVYWPDRYKRVLCNKRSFTHVSTIVSFSPLSLSHQISFRSSVWVEGCSSLELSSSCSDVASVLNRTSYVDSSSTWLFSSSSANRRNENFDCVPTERQTHINNNCHLSLIHVFTFLRIHVFTCSKIRHHLWLARWHYW